MAQRDPGQDTAKITTGDHAKITTDASAAPLVLALATRPRAYRTIDAPPPPDVLVVSDGTYEWQRIDDAGTHWMCRWSPGDPLTPAQLAARDAEEWGALGGPDDTDDAAITAAVVELAACRDTIVWTVDVTTRPPAGWTDPWATGRDDHAQ